MSNRTRGTIKYFDIAHGEGLITPDGGSEDLFVDLNLKANFGDFQTLGVGQEVEFGVDSTGGKKRAIDVTGKHRGPLILKRRICDGLTELRDGPGGGGTRSCFQCTKVNGICSVCGFYEKAVDGGGSSSGSATGRGGGPAL